MNEMLDCLINKNSSCNPVWFMRQAGRYLPEFRKIRRKNQDFIKLCLNSNLASDITLQPIKRYDLDAAIIFSDILIVPYALGQKVTFVKNKGPMLSDFNMEKFLKSKPDIFLKKLKPIYKSIKKTRKKLEKNKTLISFVGAPWTLIYYMIDIKKKPDCLRKFSKYDMERVINKLTQFLCLHINQQFKNGADIVQIFDSWAGIISKKNLNRFCFEPNKKIVQFCRKKQIPTICFPKGIGKNYKKFVKKVKPDGINIDYEVNPIWAKNNLKNVCIQGGLDPKILINSNQKKIAKETMRYMKIFKNIPYIFNLGHGILPNTKPSTIKKIVKQIRSI